MLAEIEKNLLEAILYNASLLIVLFLFLTELILILISLRKFGFPKEWKVIIQRELSILIPPILSIIAFFFLISGYYIIASIFTWICIAITLLKFLNKFLSLDKISEVNLQVVLLLMFSIILPLNINPPLLYGDPLIQFFQRIIWLMVGILGFISSTILFYQNNTFKSVDPVEVFSHLKLFFKTYVTKIDIILWVVLIIFSIPHLIWGLVLGKDKYAGIWMFTNDEWATVDLIYTMIRKGTLFVDSYSYPSLHRYLVWFILTPLYPIFEIIGFDYFFPFSLFLGRIISLIFSCMTISLVRIISQKLGGYYAAMIAPLSCILMPVFLEMSSTAKPDMMMLYFLILAIFFCFKASLENNMTYLRIGWLSMAIATTTKYNAVLGVLIPLFITISIIRNEMKSSSWNVTSVIKNKQIVLQGKYILEAVMIGLLGTPDILRNLDAYVRAVRREVDHQLTGHFGIPEGSPEYWYFKAQEQTGFDLFMTAIIGVIVVIILSFFFYYGTSKKELLNHDHLRFTVLIMLFFIPYWIALSISKVGFWHYLLPLAPFVAFGFGTFYGVIDRSRIKNRGFSFIFSAIIIFQIFTVVMMSSQSLVLQTEWLNDSRYQLPRVLSEQTNISEYNKPVILLSPHAYISQEIAGYSEIHLVNETLAEEFLNSSFQPDFIIISSWMIHRHIEYGNFLHGGNSLETAFYMSLYNGSVQNYNLIGEIESTTIKSQPIVTDDYLHPLVLSFNIQIIFNSLAKSINLLSLRQVQGPSIHIYQLNSY